MSPLPDDDEDQGRGGDQREDHDEVRFEPILALSLVEDNLQGSQAKSNETESDIVDGGFAELAASEKGWILNEPRSEQKRDDADRDVDEKNPAPGKVVGNPS